MYVPTYNFEPVRFEEDVTPVAIVVPQWDQRSRELKDSEAAKAKNWPAIALYRYSR